MTIEVNEKIWWYLSKSTGIAAMVLLVLSVVWGVLLATRILKAVDRPSWLLSMHRWWSGLALVCTGLHLLGLLLDGYIEYGLREILVPGASEYRTVAVAIGIIAFYLLVAIQITSYLRRRLPQKVWRGIHLTSYVMVLLVGVHAGLAGTDVGKQAFSMLGAILIFALAVTVAARLLLSGKRSSAA